MKPTPKTVFLPLSEIEDYTSNGYFCCAIVFSPETENDHYHGCPPYIALNTASGDVPTYFMVPKAIAYYGTQHAGYTMRGRDNAKEEGRRELQNELRDLLGIEDPEN